MSSTKVKLCDKPGQNYIYFNVYKNMLRIFYMGAGVRLNTLRHKKKLIQVLYIIITHKKNVF